MRAFAGSLDAGLAKRINFSCVREFFVCLNSCKLRRIQEFLMLNGKIFGFLESEFSWLNFDIQDAIKWRKEKKKKRKKKEIAQQEETRMFGNFQVSAVKKFSE